LAGPRRLLDLRQADNQSAVWLARTLDLPAPHRDRTPPPITRLTNLPEQYT
jgi:hypothetical protein